jgi:hypothetical protein
MMSFQDTLMNIVTIDGEAPSFVVECAWCDFQEDAGAYFDTANNIKIDHENEHGIYLDPDTGEMYCDGIEDYRPATFDPMDDIPWGTPDSWIPDNPDENGMRMSDFI